MCTFNWSCSWGCIHECKLPKIFAYIVSFKISLFSINNLGTAILTWSYNIKYLSLISFFYNLTLFLEILNCHCINNNSKILNSQVLKYYRFFYQFHNLIFTLTIFFNYFRYKCFFFIKRSISLSTNSLSTNFFIFIILSSQL